MKRVVLTIRDERPESSSALILVNRDNPLPKEYDEQLSLVKLKNDVWLEKIPCWHLFRLLGKRKYANRIFPLSGYRTMEAQKKIYADSLRENGREFTEEFVALPGCSEHQTGLAVDLGSSEDEKELICPKFPYTGIFAEFRKDAIKYGFVERYPEGKQAITNIGHEPWHFRYVGATHAAIMTQRNLVLEEYVELLSEKAVVTAI